MNHKRISCCYNLDTACVEVKYSDGSMLAIDCIAVENQFARNRFEQSELDYLIYNDPAAYADLVLSGDVAEYLQLVTSHGQLD